MPSATPIAPRATGSFAPLGRRNAYAEVAERIREHIFAHRLAPLHRLPTERDLAVQFGVSRTVVREALRTLELNGMLLVRKGPKGGIFVAQDYGRPISHSILNLLAGGEASLADLFELRQLIEPYAAGRAAQVRSDADLDELRHALARAEAQHAQGASARPHNLDFHHRIIRISGNPILAVVGQTVLQLLSERIRNVATPREPQDVLTMHRAIFTAIEAGDMDRARAIMEQDIRLIGESFSTRDAPHSTGAVPSKERAAPAGRNSRTAAASGKRTRRQGIET